MIRTQKTDGSANLKLPKQAVFETIDGNEAAAYVAYRLNEVMSIYPITPSSNMAEWCDQWIPLGNIGRSAAGYDVPNLDRGGDRAFDLRIVLLPQDGKEFRRPGVIYV